MAFIADIHIHSPYSRATSKSLNFETLYQWGCIKGISLIGTGDFTHPAWMEEIKKKLVSGSDGLLRPTQPPPPPEGYRFGDGCNTIRFMLTAEISNIYKSGGKTRKVHNLICMPDIDSAERFSSALDRIGNIHSDGRPILGLDSRDLLEIMLESSPHAVLIPAHIWTPWFSVLGSKSGFDSIEECYRDLSSHIFAAETGLSSDPPMNWRVSSLDRYTLVSNSDAHSASKLGREANCFDCDLTYDAVMDALRTGQDAGYRGTLEFFPQEGKYHYDGHRKCDICFAPQQSKTHNGRCPVCGGKLTLGVMYRVEELADRDEGIRPPSALPFTHVLSLDSVLSELIGTGPSSKKVQREYRRLINCLGPELEILLTVPLEDVRRNYSSLLEEAVSRLRNGAIEAVPGYDGEFGKIKAFRENELDQLKGQEVLFDSAPNKNAASLKRHKKAAIPETREKSGTCSESESADIATEYPGDINSDQEEAIHGSQYHIMVIAGPGTGKTRTLVERIGHLIQDKSVNPSSILAVTFSNRASQEIGQRIESMLPAPRRDLTPTVTTFHKLGFLIVKEHFAALGFRREPVILAEQETAGFFSRAAQSGTKKELSTTAASLEKLVVLSIENNPGLLSDIPRLYSQAGPVAEQYYVHKKAHHLLDFTDLLLLPLSLLANNPEYRDRYAARWDYFFVDEFQDINALQYRLLRLLVTGDKHLFVIG
ncbi:MAG: AAA family ATPase, partial [Chitinivibrionales bacterium]|nr:AAA family ATPase [Chitinivibrionales bacterium]